MRCAWSAVATLASGLALSLVPSRLVAQQVTGEPGSPGATTTLDGRRLPAPDPKFGGVIKEKASESTPWWAPRVVPLKGAPNVLLIMTDDAGFGAPGTFGGVVPRLRSTGLPGAASAIPTSTRRRSARPHVPHSLPGGTIIPWASAWWVRSQPDTPATTRTFPRAKPPSARSSATTATRRHGSGRTTTPRPGMRARWVRSTSGPSAWASSTSTGSLAGTRASGSRTSTGTRPRSIPSRACRAGTSPRRWPTRRSST